jgi:hypothetical protein
MKNINITEVEAKNVSNVLQDYLDKGYEGWEKLNEAEKEAWNVVFEFVKKI